jgi:predicted amidophosphoribosyltransferase
MMGALKQQMIDVPYYCRRCDEMLSNGQMVCPFCDNDATPIDEARGANWYLGSEPLHATRLP